MSFPAYLKYKDSGIPWLGEVPSHWHAAHLRWLARRYSGGTPDKRNIDFWENGTIPWLASGEVNQRTVLQPTTYITEDALAQSSAKWVPTGALVMALAGQGKTKGMVAQMAIDATCNQSMAAIVPRDEKYARYLFWWLEANYQNIRNMAGGDLRDGLNLELLGDIDCPIPTSSEQTAIAAFLDRETAKIDALVAEQERLVALLKEKRQAVISHAVTKGLNPGVPMKNSGIEWLDEIPAHWEMRPIKTLATLAGRIGFRGYTTADLVGEGEGAVTLSPSNISDGEISWTKCSYISWDKFSESPEIIVEPYDVVVVKTGSTYGKVGFFRADEVPPATINPQLLLLKKIKCLPEFLFHALNASHVQGLIRISNTGGTIPTMTQEFVGNIDIPVPPVEEQHLILRTLRSQAIEFSRLLEDSKRAQELLQERRAALISAAVTGKIDVRALVDTPAELERV